MSVTDGLNAPVAFVYRRGGVENVDTRAGSPTMIIRFTNTRASGHTRSHQETNDPLLQVYETMTRTARANSVAPGATPNQSLLG